MDRVDAIVDRELGRVEIREQMAVSIPRMIDTERRIIIGVLVLKAVTQAGMRTYAPEALADCARLITKSTPPVRLGHGTRLRTRAGGAPTLLGSMENGRVEQNVVRADFHYLASAEDDITEMLEKPSAVGFSIHAFGEAEPRGDGREHVLRLRSVESVDLVSDPGHNAGIFEQAFREAARPRPAEPAPELEAAEFHRAAGIEAPRGEPSADTVRVLEELGLREPARSDDPGGIAAEFRAAARAG